MIKFLFFVYGLFKSRHIYFARIFYTVAIVENVYLTIQTDVETYLLDAYEKKIVIFCLGADLTKEFLLCEMIYTVQVWKTFNFKAIKANILYLPMLAQYDFPQAF